MLSIPEPTAGQMPKLTLTYYFGWEVAERGPTHNSVFMGTRRIFNSQYLEFSAWEHSLAVGVCFA